MGELKTGECGQETYAIPRNLVCGRNNHVCAHCEQTRWRKLEGLGAKPAVGKYLVYLPASDEIETDEFDRDGWVYFDSDEISHVMPLPKRPEGE